MEVIPFHPTSVTAEGNTLVFTKPPGGGETFHETSVWPEGGRLGVASSPPSSAWPTAAELAQAISAALPVDPMRLIESVIDGSWKLEIEQIQRACAEENYLPQLHRAIAGTPKAKRRDFFRAMSKAGPQELRNRVIQFLVAQSRMPLIPRWGKILTVIWLAMAMMLLLADPALRTFLSDLNPETRQAMGMLLAVPGGFIGMGAFISLLLLVKALIMRPHRSEYVKELAVYTTTEDRQHCQQLFDGVQTSTAISDDTSAVPIGSGSRCPVCGSTRTARLLSAEFQFPRNRHCRACGTTWKPMTPLFVPLFVTSIGAMFMAIIPFILFLTLPEAKAKGDKSGIYMCLVFGALGVASICAGTNMFSRKFRRGRILVLGTPPPNTRRDSQ
jgi:hypothetical protein